MYRFDLKKKDKTEEWIFDSDDQNLKEVLKDFDDARNMFEGVGDDEDDEDARVFEELEEEGGHEGDDDLEGWVDEVDELTEEELENLQADLIPVMLVLFKVSSVDGNQRN